MGVLYWQWCRDSFQSLKPHTVLQNMDTRFLVTRGEKQQQKKNHIGALRRELLLHIFRFQFFSFWQRAFTLVIRNHTIERVCGKKNNSLNVSLTYGLALFAFDSVDRGDHMQLTSLAASPRQLTWEILSYWTSLCSCKLSNTKTETKYG